MIQFDITAAFMAILITVIGYGKDVYAYEDPFAKPGDLIIRYEGNTFGPIGGIPHIGIFTGLREIDGVYFDVIDLKIDKVSGVIRPSHWTDESRFKEPGFYSVLDSRIPVRYNNQITTFSSLQEDVKNRVRETVVKMAEYDLGRNYGKYELSQSLDGHHSSNCGDWVLDIYNRALMSEGIQVMSHRLPYNLDTLGVAGPLGAVGVIGGLRPGDLRDYAELLWGTTDPSRLPGWLPQVRRPEVSVTNVGGVQMSPHPEKASKPDPVIRNNVIKSRPSNDTGVWDITLPKEE